MGWRKTEHACSLLSRAMWLMGLLFVFRLCFIDYHGRRSGQFHHLQKMSRSNHWHGDQMEKVKTMKFIAETKVFRLIIFVEIFFLIRYFVHLVTVVAAGYSNGKINLYHIENADILHSISLEGEITCMEWVCQYCPEEFEWKPDPYTEDNFKNYLPKLQPLNKRSGGIMVNQSS